MYKKNTILIVADDKIPFLNETFGQVGSLICKPGHLITQQDLTKADILLVRTLTKVNKELLENTPVQFVGSMTAGFDHIDHAWLQQQHINWGIAKGCNAQAVAEYVICCIAALQQQNQLPTKKLKVGIIGNGAVGSRVVNYLRTLSDKILCNDPPKALQDKTFHSVPLSEFQNLDLICIHASLDTHPQFPSYHLIGQAFLAQQQPNCVILNASRGAIIDSQALWAAKHIITCLDVWENEPDINLELLQRAAIATFHIAGYTLAAKQRATLMIYQQAQTIFNLPKLNSNHFIKMNANKINLHPGSNWQKQALAYFNPLLETEMMKETLLKNPQQTIALFNKLRQEYVLRPEFLQPPSM